jgi:hypothetical protein
MIRKRLRIRLVADAGGATLAVDDRVVAAVLDTRAGLELRIPVRWEDRGVTVRAQIAVHNVDGLPIFVGMQITKDKPWKPTVYLMLEGVHLRRLDVNASHTNRTPDRERWQLRMHKHTALQRIAGVCPDLRKTVSCVLVEVVTVFDRE